jgi:hypothetical protein
MRSVSPRRRAYSALAAIVMCSACVTPAGAQSDADQSRASLEMVLQSVGVSGQLDSQVVVAWNETAHDIAFAEDQFLTFKGQRALAIMHLAMHDALNTILPVYERFARDGRRSVADPVSAAAQAAHDVLVALYPNQRSALDEKLTAWLGHDRPFRDRGIELGRETAAAILALRADDGWNVEGTYKFVEGPGQYQTTPPWNGFVAQPGFRFARPFASDSARRWRVPPPPPLTGGAYARAFREVRMSGARESTVRTEDQTAYAIWWMEFAEGSVNRLARRLVVERNLHLWVAARLFAHIATSLYDGYVAVWDAKYGYNHWRPYTAIREADNDGNPHTGSDPAWEPLRPAPPFPEYVSAHAAGCAASFGVLSSTVGPHVSFTMATRTAPPDMPTRSFGSFAAAARECADSRVQLGFHFRYATDAGLDLGDRIARHVVRHTLRRVSTGGRNGHDAASLSGASRNRTMPTCR